MSLAWLGVFKSDMIRWPGLQTHARTQLFIVKDREICQQGRDCWWKTESLVLMTESVEGKCRILMNVQLIYFKFSWDSGRAGKEKKCTFYLIMAIESEENILIFFPEGIRFRDLSPSERLLVKYRVCGFHGRVGGRVYLGY